MACGVAAGPAKYAAGSPGSARVSRKVTITTPIRLGIAIAARLRIIVSMVAPRGAASPCSSLRERAVIEPAVEPVFVAGNVLLHRDVDVGLVQRDTRHVGEGEIDEALHVLVVSLLVAGRGRGARAVDECIHLRRLVVHGVED